jgi:hypothetical protein
LVHILMHQTFFDAPGTNWRELPGCIELVVNMRSFSDPTHTLKGSHYPEPSKVDSAGEVTHQS